jgi:hypothetical protein
VVRDGRVTDTGPTDLAGLLQAMVQQQAAMLQVQAESLRLQRVLVERLLRTPTDQLDADEHGRGTEPLSWTEPAIAPTVSDAPEPPSSISTPDRRAISQPEEMAAESSPRAASMQLAVDEPTHMPSPGDQNAARGARYYQPRPSPAAKIVTPEELELVRQLQQMRDAGDLILQFGPYKGTTLAQVAMNHPEYVRQLMTRAQRPEVRAAASRLVEALDAAAEHKRRTTRGANRRGRSTT